MEQKKSNSADLSKKGVLFFQLGLILSLFLVWQIIEWEAKGGVTAQQDLYFVEAFEEEAPPVTQVEEVKPPVPPQPMIKEVEIIKDDLKVEETLIAPTEIDDPIADVSDIEVAEEIETIEDYNILSVEEVPVFPGCEDAGNNEAKRNCFGEKVNQLVGRTFNSELGSELGLQGLHRIHVSFKIQKDGSVAVIGARGPHPKLEEEAIRVVKRFPEMIPGKQGGRPVGVTYTLPIAIRIQN